MSASGPAKLLDIKKMKASELVGLMDEGRSKFAHVSSPRYGCSACFREKKIN
jgi:hypothetical protein